MKERCTTGHRLRATQLVSMVTWSPHFDAVIKRYRESERGDDENKGGGGETNTKKYLHKESALKQTGFPCDNIVNEPIHGYVAASQNHQHIKCTLTIKASQCLPTVFTIKAELYSHLLQHVYVRGHFSTAMLPYGLVNRQQKKIMVW